MLLAQQARSPRSALPLLLKGKGQDVSEQRRRDWIIVDWAGGDSSSRPPTRDRRRVTWAMKHRQSTRRPFILPTDCRMLAAMGRGRHLLGKAHCPAGRRGSICVQPQTQYEPDVMPAHRGLSSRGAGDGTRTHDILLGKQGFASRNATPPCCRVRSYAANTCSTVVYYCRCSPRVTPSVNTA
jgi:hypothetical protein